ncbi:MAG: nucleoredoxin [Verrucomicrobiota bacterium]|jgi:nucleoredoxin
MGRVGLSLSILFLSILSGFGAALPVTAKEVGLMLRSGYSSAALMHELAQRHFVGTLDFDQENLLVKSGASAELIAEINKGAYALSAEQDAKAQAAIVDQTNRRAAQTAQMEKANARYQAQVTAQRTAKPAEAPANANAIANALKGDLVKIDNGNLAPMSDDAFAKKKLIGLYFSAHWCGPCRKFTPQLVEYYNRVIAQQPDVEFVFVSADRTADAMQNYMRESKMPWPALDYAKVESNEAIRKYAGKGIPCLVIVDQTGRVISNSYDGEKYLGPEKVLGDLDTIFAGVAAKRVAGAH